MFSPKKLVKVAFVGRRRVPSTAVTAEKGHFVIYTIDQTRFEVPLWYLQNTIFQELLRMSEEELGIMSKGPMTLLFDAASMEYLVLLINRGVTDQDLEIKSLFYSIVASTCSNLASNHECINPADMLVCGY